MIFFDRRLIWWTVLLTQPNFNQSLYCVSNHISIIKINEKSPRALAPGMRAELIFVTGGFWLHTARGGDGWLRVDKGCNRL